MARVIGCVMPLVGGCAAAMVSLQVGDAAQALERAAASGAVELAPYEYTMAQRYLDKAREEHADAELRVAEALARESEAWAARARAKAASTGARPAIDELPDDAAPAIDEAGP